MSGYELRAIGPDEAEAYVRALADGFGWELGDEDVALWAGRLEPERTLVAGEGREIVATSCLLSFGAFTVPGARVPLAGVSGVSVRAVHRGHGLLDRMMRGQLEAVYERGTEAIAALWASEAALYGRYGFGMAARVWNLTVRLREARLRVPPPDRRPRTGPARELLGDIEAIHAAEAPERVGMADRDDRVWEIETADLEYHRDGAGHLRALVWDGPDGPAGYALYAIRKRWTDGHGDDDVVLRELVARTPEAARALWQVLITMSLARRVRWERAPLDDPLPHLLTDHRAVGGPMFDGMWIRLVDVARALSERRYGAPVDVVFEVADEPCPWNAGRFRLAADASGATCQPTSDPPDLSLGAAELGAAYLGGTTLAELAAAGRVVEHTAGALAVASHAGKGVREPWPAEDF